jgi:hypothetical protein
MVRPRHRRKSKGSVGTSMTGAQGHRRPVPQRNENPCPVCYSVAQQPCRTVESKPGAAVLKLGRVRQTMHEQRPGAKPTGEGKPVRKTRAGTRRQPQPVPIERVDPSRAVFVPRNLRDTAVDEQGNMRTTGWSRDNSDAIPRSTLP